MAKPVEIGLGRKSDPVRDAFIANKSLFGVTFAFSAVMSVLALTVSFYMLQVYDRVLTSQSEETLLLLTIIAVVGIATFAMLDSLRLRLLIRIGMRIAESLSANVLRAMVSLAALGGAGVKQGLRDVDTVRSFVGGPAFAALMDAPFLLFFLLFLYFLHPAFFFIVLIGGAVLIALAFANHLLTGRTVLRSIGVQSQALSFVDDGLRNADVLEGMGMSFAFVARWRAQWLESSRLGLAASDRDTVLSSITKAVRMIIQIALLGVGALLVLDFQSSGGVMIAASIIGGRALAPIEALVGTWKIIIAVRGSRERLVRLLEQAPKREEGMALPAPKGHIQVQRAGFAIFSTRKTILHNINFELTPGETLGVIGPSASGKSTLLRLLTGAWPCTSGIVRLDGADIYAWPRQRLSQYIGYLPQDIELFAGTVRDNIGRLTDAEPEAIVRAAQLAHAHEMILALPKGYDTEIGDRGQTLSGGQRQRIGIARALFGEPRFVLLDEPNANLDGAGEEALAATIVDLKKRGVTLVIVAHRPSMLAATDKILVLKDGAMDSCGPRDEILKRFVARPGPRVQTNVVQMPAVDTSIERGGI